MTPIVSPRDELDKQGIEQLHQAVLQFAGNCFESKKLCVTALISGSVLIASFTNKQVDASLFVAGAIITTFFWTLDGYNYFYQKKLRERMKELADKILSRQAAQETGTTGEKSVDGVGMPINEKPKKESIWIRLRKTFIGLGRAAFNTSMVFYIFLVLLNLVLAFSFYVGLIKAAAATGAP